eukprot:gene21374-19285_t
MTPVHRLLGAGAACAVAMLLMVGDSPVSAGQEPCFNQDPDICTPLHMNCTHNLTFFADLAKSYCPLLCGVCSTTVTTTTGTDTTTTTSVTVTSTTTTISSTTTSESSTTTTHLCYLHRFLGPISNSIGAPTPGSLFTSRKGKSKKKDKGKATAPQQGLSMSAQLGQDGLPKMPPQR